jgi:hypothetical protein
MAERLPRDRPLWAIDVVEPLKDGTRAVIWRIHHAMADGQAAMAIGSALLWSESTDPEPDPPQLPRAKPLPSSNRLIAAALSDRARAVGHTAHGIGRRVASRRRLRESLTTPNSCTRSLRTSGTCRSTCSTWRTASRRTRTSFALSVSNVRGPAGTQYLAKGQIREVYSLAEIAPHHALRVSAISFAGRIAIGLCADGDAIPELPRLAEGVERSLVELTEGVTPTR